MVAPTATTVAVLDATGTSKSLDAIQDGGNSNAIAPVHCLVDGKLNAGTKATILAGSTNAAAADPALVVALSPNNPNVMLLDKGGTNQGVVKAASTPAAAADTALVVALSPNNGALLTDRSGVNQGTIKAASTAAATTDTALVVETRPTGVNTPAPGTTTMLGVCSDGSKGTYATGALAFSLPATPSDVVQITGSATKTVRIKKIVVSGQATTNKIWPLSIIRRAAAISGGTPTTPVITKFDTNDASVTAVVTHYASGGLGTPAAANPASSVMFAYQLDLTAPATVLQPISIDLCTHSDKAIVLRGAADCLVLNLGGGALVAGETLSYCIEWEEDNS